MLGILKWLFEDSTRWPVGHHPVVAEHAIIASALQRLVEARNRPDFIIIDGWHTRGFVQFAYDEQEGLFLDLPVAQMTDAESARAATFFSRLGVPAQPNQACGEIYNLGLSDDVDRGAELTLQIFREVFAAPVGFEVRISAG